MSFTVAGYTDEENPFGDPLLSAPFRWEKREEKRAQQGLDARARASEADRRFEIERRLMDIERIKRRRVQREVEHRAMQEQKARERSAQENGPLSYAEVEERFHLSLAVKKIVHRLRNMRPRPADTLYHSIAHRDACLDLPSSISTLPTLSSSTSSSSTSSSSTSSSSSSSSSSISAEKIAEEIPPVFDGSPLVLLHSVLGDKAVTTMGAVELEALEAEMDLLYRVEVFNDQPHLAELWQLLGTAASLLVPQEALDFSDEQRSRSVREKLDATVDGRPAEELRRMLSHAQQRRIQDSGLQDQAEEEQEGAGRGEEREHWGALCDRVQLELAKLAAAGLYETLVATRLAEHRAKHGFDLPVTHKLYYLSERPSRSRPTYGLRRLGHDHRRRGTDEGGLGGGNDQDGDEDEEDEDDEMVEAFSEEFNHEYQLLQSRHQKPGRELVKPMYCNRIYSGYDWSRYNKLHFDKEHPPEKTVKGYKILIQLPDLRDPSRHAPRYFLEPFPSDPRRYEVLRVSSGPPYADIAFQIVKKPWFKGKRSGFKCAFARGVFTLAFRFKKGFYRR